MLDATSRSSPHADHADRAVTAGLAAHWPGAGGEDRGATADASADGLPRPLLDWLLGRVPAAPRAVGTSPGSAPRPAPGRGTEPPAGAALVLPGLAAWGPPTAALLARRPDLRAVAVLDPPPALDWPEYALPAVVASLPAALAAVAAHAACIIASSEAAAMRLVAITQPSRSVSVVVEPRPSALAGTAAPTFDPALAAARAMVAFGPIEARGNTLLLLQIWRDLMARGGAVPKLVLAGARGGQIEDIRPMLDWNQSLRAHVAEAPGLTPAALRMLVDHAQAVLAPDFTGHDAALLRDARACRAAVIIAGSSAAVPSGDTTLSPIDGRGWREAVLAAAGRPARSAGPPPTLPDWQDYTARVVAHARET